MEEAMDFKDLLDKKYKLYLELYDILKEERDALIKVDIDRLFNLSDRKQNVCSSIEQIEDDIRRSKQDYCIDTEFENVLIKERLYKINAVRIDIDILRKENSKLITDILEFIDNIISILCVGGDKEIIYDRNCNMVKRVV